MQCPRCGWPKAPCRSLNSTTGSPGVRDSPSGTGLLASMSTALTDVSALDPAELRRCYDVAEKSIAADRDLRSPEAAVAAPASPAATQELRARAQFLNKLALRTSHLPNLATALEEPIWFELAKIEDELRKPSSRPCSPRAERGVLLRRPHLEELEAALSSERLALKEARTEIGVLELQAAMSSNKNAKFFDIGSEVRDLELQSIAETRNWAEEVHRKNANLEAQVGRFATDQKTLAETQRWAQRVQRQNSELEATVEELFKKSKSFSQDTIQTQALQRRNSELEGIVFELSGKHKSLIHENEQLETSSQKEATYLRSQVRQLERHILNVRSPRSGSTGIPTASDCQPHAEPLNRLAAELSAMAEALEHGCTRLKLLETTCCSDSSTLSVAAIPLCHDIAKCLGALCSSLGRSEKFAGEALMSITANSNGVSVNPGQSIASMSTIWNDESCGSPPGYYDQWRNGVGSAFAVTPELDHQYHYC